MSDKQIIIDRVDVSEWTDEEIRYNFEKHSPKAIRQTAFDLYKQLKHKEQKCEELNKTITNLENIRDEFSTKLDQLKGENVGALKQLEFVRTLNTVQEAEIRKLTKTLAEIKEIAEKSCCLQPTSICEEYENCNECSRTSDDATVKQIIQKISECEVRDDKSNR